MLYVDPAVRSIDILCLLLFCQNIVKMNNATETWVNPKYILSPAICSLGFGTVGSVLSIHFPFSELYS